MPKSSPAPQTPLEQLEGAARPQLLRGSRLSAVTAGLWPLQAACVAWFLAGLLQDVASAPRVALVGFVALGLLRAWLGAVSEGMLQSAARDRLTQLRTEMTRTETTRTTTGPRRGAGAIGALASTKLDLLTPYMTRYRPARMRVMLVPPVILALSFWHAWAVGLVLLVAGPLIPVFMALVGWAAKEASARQLAEVGDMNDLLVERLSALPDIRALGAGRRVQDGFAAKAEDLRRRTMAVLAVAFMSSTVLELFSGLGVALVAVFVGFSLLDVVTFGSWGAPLSPAAGIFLLLLAPDFFQPLRDLASAWHDKAAADAVADELTAWRQADPAPRLGAGVPPTHCRAPPVCTLARPTCPVAGTCRGSTFTPVNASP